MSNEIKNNKGAVVKEVNGVKYFKLQSKYPGDYTKNCGLLSNEIDENFFFLRSYDIQSMQVDENRNLILTRVDGDKLIVNISEEIGYPTFEFIKEEGKIIVHYPDGTTEEMDGFLIEGQDIKVATDYTIKGDGRKVNPLRISEVERTGTYAPAKRFYDLTESGSTMPEPEGKGYRIVTKERTTPFGCLYDYFGVEKIQEALNQCGSPWRVPSRKDWADMLNSAEPCGYDDVPHEDRKHDTLEINKWTGLHSGARAKTLPESSGGTWIDSDNTEDGWPVAGEDSLPSTGSLGTFHVIPVGYDEGSIGPMGEIIDRDVEGLKLLSSFWTSTPTGSHIKSNIPNVFTRTFAYNRGKVLQESSKPGSRLSLRLVRDFDFDSFNEYENILGHQVPCVLISNPRTNYSKIWTSVNIGFTEGQYSGTTCSEWSALSGDDREFKDVYYINEWNGAEWVKKAMNPGDSVVILDYDCDPSTSGDTYHEWRVYENEDGTSELIDTAEALKEEFQKEIDELNEKVDELSAKTEEIEENLEDEIARAQSAETMLAEAIDELDEKVDDEIARAQSAETMLQEEIDELDEKVDDEIARAQSAETYLQEEIDSIEIREIEPESSNILKSYELFVNDEVRGATINIPKDKSIKSISTGYSGSVIDVQTGEFIYEPESGDTEVIRVVYQISDGTYSLTEISIENLIYEHEFADGLEVGTDHKVRVKINPDSDAFLTVDPDGVLLTGVAKTFDNVAKDVIGADGNPYDGYNIDFYDAVWSPVEETEAEGHPHTLVKIPDDYAQIPSASGWTGEEYIEVFYTQTSVHEWYRNVTTNNYIDSAQTIVEAIKDLDAALKTESDIRKENEQILQDEIDAETERAMSAETMLQEEIDSVSGEVTTLSGAVQDFSAATVDEIARLDGKDIADTGADHSLSVTQGLSLERENGEKVEIDIDTNFGLLPNYE